MPLTIAAVLANSNKRYTHHPIQIKPKEVKKPEEKKEARDPPEMKSWPKNKTELISYVNLIKPLKEVLNKGYRLFRKDDVKSFLYDGFNIGEFELQNQPSPQERFKETFIAEQKKLGFHLIDIVLNIAFLLGVEQGRRAEHRELKSQEELINTLAKYREINKDLRAKIDELEVILEIKNKSLSEEDAKLFLTENLSARRKRRIEDLKSDLKIDPSKSSFNFVRNKAKFKSLEILAESLSIKTCSKEQWYSILDEYGWTVKEWKDKCKKKSSKNDFI